MMDSERPIEKMLRASAEKRRAEAGAPFEMHPATRRLLQGEVARTHRPVDAPRPAKPWFAGLWLRTAGAVATIAILGLAARMVWNSETRSGESVQLANTIREESAPETVLGDQSGASTEASPMAAVPEQARRLLEPGPTESQPARLQVEPAASPASRSVPAAPSSAPEETSGALYARRGASPPPGSPAKGLERDKRDELALGLSLAESTREAPATRAPAPTLENRTASAPVSTLTTPSLEVAKSAVVADGVLNLDRSSMGRSAQSMGNFEVSKEKVAEAEDLSLQAKSFGGSGGVASNDNSQGQRQLFYNQITNERFGKQTVAGATVLHEGVATSPQAPEAVLVSFSVENTGREIRITDRDGSVYAGPVKLTNQQVLGQTFAAAPPQLGNLRGGAEPTPSVGFELKNLPPDQPPQYYWFRVSGTNRTLNQKIEFEGNLAQNLDPTLAANSQNYGLISNNSRGFTNQAASFQNQAVISGRVVIDGKTEMKVNAQAAP